MSYEAKSTLLNSVEQQLSSILTVSDMTKVMQVLAEQLDNYDLTQHTVIDTRDDMLESYISALTIEGRSEKTIDRYKYIITKLMDYVKIPTRQVTVHHLRGFLAVEKERGISDTTLEGDRQVFCAYFNWLYREGLISTNPVLNLGAIKCMKKVKHIYSDVDLEKIKSKCKSDRDAAIVCFLLSSGCRISEMTQLNRDSINISSCECKVLGKGNKERKVYFDSVTAMFLTKYLDSRTDDNEALFIGKRSERLRPGGVRYILHQIGVLANVENVHPHRFRRTFATTRAARGMSIQEIAWLLGHEKLDTTMKYIEKNDEDIKYSYRKFSK